MPKADILKILQVLGEVITRCNLTDEESQALVWAAAKTIRPKKRRKK